MKVISIKQPWASLIIYGYKSFEFRGWQTKYRGDLLIHASKTFDNLAKDKFKEYDLILVDTAGRSHKNKEQCMEMLHFANDCVIPEDCTKEVFIVLSASTKYKDLENIVDVYSEIGNYNIIFTKLDETSAFGNILNIKLKTGGNLSYVTSGQVVPDDIRLIDAQKMAKSLLGGVE